MVLNSRLYIIEFLLFLVYIVWACFTTGVADQVLLAQHRGAHDGAVV